MSGPGSLLVSTYLRGYSKGPFAVVVFNTAL